MSAGSTASTALLVDARQVAASAGTVSLAASGQATVDMGGPDTTSLWQKNMLGLRAERFFGYELLRETGAAVVTDVDWSGGSPA